MLTPSITQNKGPIAVLGAGDLVSHLHRAGEVGEVAGYRFNVFRLNRQLQATHELHHSDLHDMIKLCQVLAFAIVDDGWIPKETSDSLRQLCNQLDVLTRQWSDTDDG